MIGNDAIGDRQAQAGPFALALRREEGFEDPRHYLGCHARPRIPDRQAQGWSQWQC